MHFDKAFVIGLSKHSNKRLERCFSRFKKEEVNAPGKEADAKAKAGTVVVQRWHSAWPGDGAVMWWAVVLMGWDGMAGLLRPDFDGGGWTNMKVRKGNTKSRLLRPLIPKTAQQ